MGFSSRCSEREVYAPKSSSMAAFENSTEAFEIAGKLFCLHIVEVWEGDATTHFSVKKRFFIEEG